MGTRPVPRRPSWPVPASSRIWSSSRPAAASSQYVILGAGLDTFAQRRPEIAVASAGIRGRPAGPPGLEAAAPDRARLRHPRLAAARAGRFRSGRRLVGASWRPPASMPAGRRSWPPPASACTSPGRRSRPRCARSRRSPPGSTLAMTFLLPLELVEPEPTAPGSRWRRRARGPAGTPFISFFTPAEMLALAREAGFRDARHVSAAELAERYFEGRAGRPAPTDQRRGTAGRDDVAPVSHAHWTASFQLAHTRI